MQEKIWMDTI